MLKGLTATCPPPPLLNCQDIMELQAEELRSALADMHAQGRYRELMLVLDTCESESMLGAGEPLGLPGVVLVGSSSLHENSYAHGNDAEVRVGPKQRTAVVRPPPPRPLPFVFRCGAILSPGDACPLRCVVVYSWAFPWQMVSHGSPLACWTLRARRASAA